MDKIRNHKQSSMADKRYVCTITPFFPMGSFGPYLILLQLLNIAIFNSWSNKFDVFTGQVGKYKSTYWQFQNEKRYILRFIPINGLDKINSPQISTFVYNKLKSNDNDFLDYFDLTLDDEAFNSMEVTMSPQFTEGNRILLELLKEKYNPNMIIQESALKDKIIL